MTIPYVTATGKVIELRVRQLGKEPKYMPVNRDFPLPTDKFHLFNAQQAMPTSRRRTVYICEGELDAVLCVANGYKAVAVPGAGQWQRQWNFLFSEAEVRIVFDGDEAGRKGAENLASRLAQDRIEVTVLDIPDGMDISDVYIQHGPDALHRLLTQA